MGRESERLFPLNVNKGIFACVCFFLVIELIVKAAVSSDWVDSCSVVLPIISKLSRLFMIFSGLQRRVMRLEPLLLRSSGFAETWQETEKFQNIILKSIPRLIPYCVSNRSP